jgi:hypothetical protein
VSIGLDIPRSRAGGETKSQSAPHHDDRPPAVVRNISFSNIHGTVTTAPPPLPDYPFPRGYNPGEGHSCIVLNSVDGTTIENISFDDIGLVFGGGGTAAEAARRDLPQIAGEYFALGPMPAYGFYARHTRGLMLRNMRFEFDQTELRPAMILDHVADVAINGLSVQADPGMESALRFTAAQDVLLTAARLLTPTPIFLQIEGGENAGIAIESSDLSKATQPLACRSGAEPSAVKLRI